MVLDKINLNPSETLSVTWLNSPVMGSKSRSKK
jgi:hypothetical protein